jgi:hypothetical protein
MDMAHLRPEAYDLALLPANERLARLPANRWIGYTRASEALTLLGRLLDSEPGRVRPRNLLIVGPTNNGKTAIAGRSLRDHPQRPSANDEHEVFPVLLVQMPPSQRCAGYMPQSSPGLAFRAHCIRDGQTGKALRCHCWAGSRAACW